MNTYTIDFSDGGDMSRSITWQFDNATIIKGIILDIFGLSYRQTTEEFWTRFHSDFLDINTATTEGLSFWGSILSVRRPDGISDSLYRRIIKAKACLLNGNASIGDYRKYLLAIFGAANPSVSVTDNLDMSMTFSFPETFADDGDVLASEFAVITSEINVDILKIFPAGVREGGYPGIVFGLAGQEGGLMGYTTGNIDNSNFFR